MRAANRHYQLWLPDGTFAEWEQQWPGASRSAALQTNLYDYYQCYVLVCPACGHAWCRSTCDYEEPTRVFQRGKWSIRERWCEAHMQNLIDLQMNWYGGQVVYARHCPGTVLSFDDRDISEGVDPETWESHFWHIPEPWRTRELRLWCLFDSILNPAPPPAVPEPEPDPEVLKPVSVEDPFAALFQPSKS